MRTASSSSVRSIGPFRNCAEAIKLDPADGGADHNRGCCRAAQGQHAGAIRDLTEALRLGVLPVEDTGGVYYNRGLAHHALGHHAAAIADFTAAIATHPPVFQAYAERARCYREVGDEASAERDLKEAKRLGASVR